MKSIKKLFKFLIVIIVLILLWQVIPFGTEFLSISKYNGEDINFEVAQGTFASDVAQQLEEKGIIKSKYTFLAKLKLMPADKSAIYYGTHTIKKGMSLGDILKEFTSMPDTIRCRFPNMFMLAFTEPACLRSLHRSCISHLCRTV